MVTDGNVEHLVHERKKLRFGSLQLLLSQKLYKEETERTDKPVDTINDQENISHDKIKSFQDRT